MVGEPTDERTIRLPLRDLREDQVRLVRSILRGGDVPVAITGRDLIVPVTHAGAARDAIAWVARADGPPPAEEVPEDLHSRHRPLVRPSRPPLPDGRRPATRYRRLAGAVVDGALLGAPAFAAQYWTVAPCWLIVAVHGAATALPLWRWGWTVGKLAVGTRVVKDRTARPLGLLDAVTRWTVAATPLFVGAFTGLAPDATAGLVLAVHAPILANLRGLPDLAARSMVVESTRSGPGGVPGRRRAKATSPLTS